MSAELKLLMVSNFFDTHRGGLEIVAGRLARELAKRGFDVTWLATRAAPAPPDACAARVRTVAVSAWNVAERRLGVPFPLLAPGALGQIASEVRAADAVLIHDSLYPISLAAFRAARRAGKPVVIIQHIGHIRYRNPAFRTLMALGNRLVGAPLLRGADQVVFISETVREYFSALRLKSTSELIFNGVDTDVFRPPAAGEALTLRARLGLPAHAPVALFVGRFVEKKGVPLIRLMAERRGDIVFAMAGWGHIDPDGWGLPNVKVFSDLSGAPLADLYRASDVFLLPSKGEGFPLVIQEALACGLPVICGAESARADPEAARFLTGVETEAAPSAALADAALAALEAALAADAAATAAERVALARDRYAWSAAADRYAAILRRLAARCPAATAPAAA